MFEGNGMKIVNYVATFLASIGALNWGLGGLLNHDLITSLVGQLPVLLKVVQALIGGSGLWSAFSLFTRDSYKC